ncbi:MAG: DcaP family trimeric outer membrane transporter [Bacteroidales bacterium]
MKQRHWLLLSCLISFCWLYALQPMYAQKKKDDRAMLYFLAKDTVDRGIIGYFYSLQGPAYSDPLVPKFIIASRNRNLLLGIGGYVRLRGSYDFRGVCDSEEFHTYDIGVPNAGNPSQELRMNAGSSRLFMRLIANTSRIGRLVAYIEGDFLGQDRAFRLRQANISFLGFTFGQALSTYVDSKSYAPSLDQNGGIVALNQRSPLVRYEHSFKNGIGIAVSAELPPFSGTYQEGVTGSASAQVPDFPFYIQYRWKECGVRLTGIVRDLPYHDILHNSWHRVFGAGAKLSGNFCFTPFFQGVGYVSYGKGISTYTLDLSGAGMDILPDYDRSGKMFAPRTAVYYGGLRINFSRNVYSGLSYSYLRLYTNSSFRSAPDFDASSFYKYAQSATVALIWDFLPSATCGVEYLWGQRVNYDGSKGHANRIYTSIRYNF